MDSQPASEVVAIVVTGPVGAGKSTVMDAISELLEARGIRHAAIDQDCLRVVHPYPDDEPFGETVGYRNLAAIWPNLVGYNVRCVIIADVVEDRAASLAAYAAAMPGTKVVVVRLDVPMPVILRRLERRESDDSVTWFLNRAPELQGIMERGKVEDVLIEVGDRAPHDVAVEILQRTEIVS